MANKIKELEEKLKQERAYVNSLNDRLGAGRHYLMSVQSDEITVEDALEAFGFGHTSGKQEKTIWMAFMKGVS